DVDGVLGGIRALAHYDGCRAQEQDLARTSQGARSSGGWGSCSHPVVFSLESTPGWPGVSHRNRPARHHRLYTQNATFTEPENTRGVEYCPCTIVLSFDSRWTSFDRFSTSSCNERRGPRPFAVTVQPIETSCVKCGET